jgi:hypothetical protein
MAYILIAYLCITLPLMGWIVLSCEGVVRKSLAGGFYVLISGVLLWTVVAQQTWLNRMMDGFLDLGKADNIPISCRGSFDEAEAGLRHIRVGDGDSLQAGVGKHLMVRGWIGSINSIKNPITVRMAPKNGGIPDLTFKVTQEKRPDVAKYNFNPMLEQSGFKADIVLPHDLPLGSYRLIIDCRDGKCVEEFIPRCGIDVVPAEIGIALDAPLQRALDEQQALLSKQAPTPVPKITKKERPKNKKRREAQAEP